MTNEKKIEILTKMRELIENRMCAGFCGAYGYIMNIEPTEELLNQIGLFKPKESSGVFWYLLFDRDIRIQKINEAIENFKSNKMTNTEIQNEIKSCEEKLAKLREQMNKPQTLEEYYKGKGMYHFCTEGITRAITKTYKIGCYPSEHTAKKALAQCKLMQIAYMLNEGDCISESDTEKAYIYFADYSNDYKVSNHQFKDLYGFVLFKSKELAWEALDGIKSGRFGMTIDELKLALI